MSTFREFLGEGRKAVEVPDMILGKHNDLVGYDAKEFRMGIKVEQEHVPDGTPRKIAHEIARRIVLDHLAEHEHYYSRLKKMESESEEHTQTVLDTVMKPKKKREVPLMIDEPSKEIK